VSGKGFVVHVIRHADAGMRGAVNDDRRPLSRRGRTQADGIAAALADAGIERLASSPFTRCVETLEPLGARLGIPVEQRDDLAEGAGGRGALTIIETAPGPLVLCSHGDVIGDLLVTLDRRGVPLDDDRCAKGSTWALTVRDGSVVAAHYVPAPKADTT
jgi:broad specificity phosphatase PhoE